MSIKVINDKLTDGEAELCTTDLRFDETYTFMNEQDAMALICSLVKVFQIPNSDIEVIHFPAGANKAQCLRNAADRLDREGESVWKSEVSCPPEYAADNWESENGA